MEHRRAAMEFRAASAVDGELSKTEQVVKQRYLFLCLAQFFGLRRRYLYSFALVKCKRTMMDLSLRSIVSFDLHPGRQPSQHERVK